MSARDDGRIFLLSSSSGISSLLFPTKILPKVIMAAQLFLSSPPIVCFLTLLMLIPLEVIATNMHLQ